MVQDSKTQPMKEQGLVQDTGAQNSSHVLDEAAYIGSIQYYLCLLTYLLKINKFSKNTHCFKIKFETLKNYI